MSVKIKAKNLSNSLQTLTCNNSGRLNVFNEDITTITKSNLTSLNQTITQNNPSSVFDLSTNISSSTRLWGNSNTHHDMILQFSNDNSNWISVDNINVLNINTELTFNLIITSPPKYIRLFNNHNQTIIINAHLELH